MGEYKTKTTQEVFDDIADIMSRQLGDAEKSALLRTKAAEAYDAEDDGTAAAYYDEAIALGCIEPDALGEVLFRCGVSFAGLDDNKSFDMLKRAAEMGHVRAMLNLAVCYQKAIGTAKNEK